MFNKTDTLELSKIYDIAPSKQRLAEKVVERKIGDLLKSLWRWPELRLLLVIALGLTIYLPKFSLPIFAIIGTILFLIVFAWRLTTISGKEARFEEDDIVYYKALYIHANQELPGFIDKLTTGLESQITDTREPLKDILLPEIETFSVDGLRDAISKIDPQMRGHTNWLLNQEITLRNKIENVRDMSDKSLHEFIVAVSNTRKSSGRRH